MNDALEEINRHCGVVAEGHSGVQRELQAMPDEFGDGFKEMCVLTFDRKTCPDCVVFQSALIRYDLDPAIILSLP